MDNRLRYVDFFDADTVYVNESIKLDSLLVDKCKIKVVGNDFSLNTCQVENAIYFISDRKRKLKSNNYDEYIVVPGFSNPRWIIRNDANIINNQGNIIKPTSFLAYTVWEVAKFISKFDYMSLIFPNRIIATSRSLEKNILANDSNSIGIIYTGAKGEFQKFTLQVWHDSKSIVSYLKFGNQSQSRKKVGHEHHSLELLSKIKFDRVHIPKILRFKLDSDHAMLETQNIVTGQDKKVDVLLNVDYLALLEIYNESGKKNTSVSEYINDKNIYKSVILDLLGENFHVNISNSHGDYTPWNRFILDNEVKIIDWEDFSKRVMCYDLVTFLFSEGVLIKKSNLNKIQKKCESAILKFNMMTGEYIESQRVKKYLLVCLVELYDNFPSGSNDDFVLKLTLLIDRIIVEFKK
jgi:hypothetical protein